MNMMKDCVISCGVSRKYLMNGMCRLLMLLLLMGCKNSGRQEIVMTENVWSDTAGEPINAHGGGILYHDGTYYWYGEHKSDFTTNAMVGITCYSSENLVDWDYRGVVLPVETEDTTSDIIRGCVMERPKVIYNAVTDKFVMWLHLELKDQGYAAARSAVAVSDSPTGPFAYLGSLRPNAGKLPFDMTAEQKMEFDALNVNEHADWWTPEWFEEVRRGLYVKRDLSGGQMARDMQLFVDDDGKAYHIYSSEENLTLHIAELADDYLKHTGKYVRVAPGGHNEAPALFKWDNRYWMITSGCTGWKPNAARLLSAPDIWGPWTQHPNPCSGPKAEITFGGQGTCVLPVHGKNGLFIFMADVWKPEKPDESRYIWLPLRFVNGMPVVEWQDSWKLD